MQLTQSKPLLCVATLAVVIGCGRKTAVRTAEADACDVVVSTMKACYFTTEDAITAATGAEGDQEQFCTRLADDTHATLRQSPVLDDASAATLWTACHSACLIKFNDLSWPELESSARRELCGER